MKRINITMDDVVDERVLRFCKDHNITRSALISTAVISYITAQEMMPSVQKQIDELKIELEKLTIK